MRTLERRWRAMGTRCHVVAVVDDDTAGDPTELAAHRIEELEARWSRFRPGSEINRINEAAGVPVAVGPETLRAIELALDGRERTAGRFDPTVLPALVAAGYDRSFDELPAVVLRGPHRPAGAAVRVDRGTVAVDAGAGIDLGGIGKGLAADLVAEALLDIPGVAGACVNLGGDLRVLGTAPAPVPEAWGVEVEGGPVLALAEGGVATSTTTKRCWAGGHHVIDPRTGAPAVTPAVTTTVVAATAADAEIAATAALLDPDTVDDDTPALVVDRAGHTTATRAMEAYLR